jgi:hypothetical protein
MHRLLVVANQTLTSDALHDAIENRLAKGPVGAYVVVPLTVVRHGLSWDEDEARRVADERLDGVLERLREMGVEADGEIGDRDPVQAVRDAMRGGREVDEVIVSTLHRGASRWLGEDVPSRLTTAVSVPITIVTQAAP